MMFFTREHIAVSDGACKLLRRLLVLAPRAACPCSCGGRARNHALNLSEVESITSEFRCFACLGLDDSIDTNESHAMMMTPFICSCRNNK